MSAPLSQQQLAARRLWESPRRLCHETDKTELKSIVKEWMEHRFTVVFLQMLEERENECRGALLHPIVTDQHKTEHNKNFGTIETLIDVRQMCVGIIELCNIALKERNDG